MIKRIIPSALAVMLIFPLVLTSSANQLSDAQSDLKQVQQEAKDLNGQKNQVKNTILNDQKTRDQLVSELEKQGYQKSQIEEKIQEIVSAIATLNGAIAQAEGEYADQLKLFQERMISMYIRSKTQTDYDLLIQSADVNELFKKRQAMEMVAQFDQDLMDSIEAKKKEIEELKTIKEQEEANAADQLQNSLKAINQIEVSRAAYDTKIAQNQQSLKQIESDLDSLEKDAQELTAIIKKLSSSNTSYGGGTMKWPTPGYTGISSPFGYRMHPILKVKKFHGGVDINAPYNAAIHAAANGTVIWSGWRSGGGGNTIIIDHGGGVTTLYLHIRNGGLLVKAGQTVKAGDVIAKVGSTGLSTGPHLHFEIRVNGERQDPLDKSLKYFISAK